MQPGSLIPRGARRLALGLALLLLPGGALRASNPRWVTGQPYFNTLGKLVAWYTLQPRYFTDPGDLSASVDHAAADALVAAAAGVWNVPTAAMDLEQGGTLDEQVSGSNVYMSVNGPVFPADAESANYAAKQIAIVYDRDGSVTELLLGGGSSAPLECFQNGVTESVDSISPSGQIQHAILVINGRCTGPAPEQQLQLQYQLERAFGRILGLGWSQANDNVFTGTPQPTYDQALHWPILHPIDVVCGPYTYQCLPQPFTLRPDDVASVSFLYGNNGGNLPAGKQNRLDNAMALEGSIRFPNQEGMAGVNILVRRNWDPQQILEGFDEVSVVAGDFTQQIGGNPIAPKPSTLAGSFGQINPNYDVAGYFNMPYIPIPDGQYGQDILMHTEPVNPLYTGEYAIGSYTASTVTPSGDPVRWRFNYLQRGWDFYWEPTAYHLAANCSTGSDGTETAPAPVPAAGWWTGVLCGANQNQTWSYAHVSWVSLPVQANRNLTVEVTGQDEAGLATANKVRPAIGIWSAADAPGTPPSVAAQAVAFNGVAVGMTTVTTAPTTQAATLRIALASETGDGRPDYNYQARVLYADSISPITATAGTQVTLSGLGFRPGNTVTFNGVVASVTSWTNTAIVATVPRLPGVLPGAPVAVDVAVTDISTRGTTVMGAAFAYIYTAPTYTMQIVSTPSASQVVNIAATPSFTVKVQDTDGITPLAGATVTFSAVAGSVAWQGAGGNCAGATCTVVTDATGQASATATALQAGTVTLQAAAVGLTQQTSFNAVPLVRSISVLPPVRYIAAGATATWTAIAHLQQQGQPAAGAPVGWTASSGQVVLSATQTVSDSGGAAQATVTAGPLAGGAQAGGTVCGWTGVCAGFTVFGVDGAQYQVVVTGGAGQNIAAADSFAPITLQVTDAAGNPVVGAAVQIHQSVGQYTAPCPPKGRCPSAPVLRTVDASAVTDGNGNLSVTPQTVTGPEVTDIAVSAGKYGYATLILRRHP